MVRNENLNYNKIAKEHDKTGSWAIQGMDAFVSDYFNISELAENGMDASEYITETYLECISSISFEEWLKNGNENGKVMILDESDFRRKYSEINKLNLSLNGMIEDITTFYDCEWYIFSKYEYERPFLLTTNYKEYSKINIIEIERSMSAFNTLLTTETMSSKRRQILIDRINQASNNLLERYAIDKMSDEQLFDLIDSKFRLGYCDGKYSQWEL